MGDRCLILEKGWVTETSGVRTMGEVDFD